MALPPLVNVLFLYERAQISLVTMNWLCLCLFKFPSGPQKAITARGKGVGAKQCTWTQRIPPAYSPCLHFPLSLWFWEVQQVLGKPVPYLNPGCHTAPALCPSALATVMITPTIIIPIQLEWVLELLPETMGCKHSSLEGMVCKGESEFLHNLPPWSKPKEISEKLSQSLDQPHLSPTTRFFC